MHFKIKSLLISLLIRFFSINCQSYFVTTNYDQTESFCVTNTSSALSWNFPSVESTYADVDQTNIKCNGDNDCFSNFNNWQVKNSIEENVGEIIVDRRWETFKLTQFLNVKEHYKVSDNFQIPFSVKSNEQVNLYFCDEESIYNSHCYWLILQGWSGETSAFRKCYTEKIQEYAYPAASCKKLKYSVNHDSIGNFFTKNYWSHFLIKKSINTFQLFDHDKKVLMEYTDDEDSNQINVSHFFITSPKEKENYKVHNYNFAHLTTKISNYKLAEISVPKNIDYVCISMFIKICKSCQISLTLKDFYTDKTLKRQIYEDSENWIEIKFFTSDILISNVILEISTQSTNDLDNNWWSINDIKLCEKNNIRFIKNKGAKADCQLISQHDTIAVTDETNKKELNCPTDAIGSICVPCKYFFLDCDYIVYCENKECHCSAGYYGQNCYYKCNYYYYNNNYGHGCFESCSQNCKAQKCNHINGNCNCKHGYTGPKCTQDDFYYNNPLQLVNKSENSCTVEKTDFSSNRDNVKSFQLDYSKDDTYFKLYESGKIYTNSNPITIYNLEPNTVYYIRAIVYFQNNAYNLSSNIPVVICKTTCNNHVDASSLKIKATSHMVYIFSETITCKNIKFILKSPKAAELYTCLIFTDCKDLHPFTMYEIYYKESLIIDFRTEEGIPDKVENLKLLSVTESLINITWDSPNHINGILKHYLIEFQVDKLLACKENSFPFPIYNATTTDTFITLTENISPNAKYFIKVYAVNGKYQSISELLYTQTYPLDQITDIEIPKIVNITESALVLSYINCTQQKGDLYIAIEANCSNLWCSKHFFPYQKYQRQIPIVNDEIFPFSDYQFNFSICRQPNNNCVSQIYTYKTPPQAPNAIKFLQVYSKSSLYIRLRWKAPWPPSGILRDYKIQFEDSRSRKQYKTIVNFTCLIWKDWHCASIEIYNTATYYITVSARNEVPDEYGVKSIEVQTYSISSRSEKPENVSLIWTNDNKAILIWQHPEKTNGDLSYFLIEYCLVENGAWKTKQYKLADGQYNLTYTIEIASDFLPSSNYDFSISGFNGVKGEKTFLRDLSRPEIPQIDLEILGNDNNLIVQVQNLEYKNLSIFFSNSLNDRQLTIENFHPFIKCGKVSNLLEIQFENLDQNCQMIYKENFALGYSYNICSLVVNTFKEKSSYKIYCNNVMFGEAQNLNYLFLLLLAVILIPFIILLVKRKNKSNLFNYKNKENEENICLTDTQTKKTPLKTIVPFVMPPTTNSKRVNIVDLENYVKQAVESNELYTQHCLFPNGPTHTWDYGILPENKAKNRYTNLIAYDHSRVVLQTINNDKYSDYINANYIHGYKVQNAYIATQGPKKTTVYDFWRMIWQENVEHIVMLANLVENGKSKVYQYWPDINKTETYVDISVTFQSNKVFFSYEERFFEITHQNKSKTVNQLHFSMWPDHGIPLYAQTLVPLLKRMLTFKLGATRPLVVHCSAGVGRTGTIILCDINLRMAAREGAVDMLATLERMRNQRPNMVDNAEQYKLAHMVIMECLIGMQTSYTCQLLQSQIEEITDERAICLQMKYLRQTAWQDQAMKTVASNMDIEIVKEKNRIDDVVPESHGCIRLTAYPSNDPESTYINAVHVDGYRSPGRFIVTQFPMPNTLGDFWRLAYEMQIKLIVVLNSIPEQDHTCCQFWPADNREIFKPVDFLQIDFVEQENYEVYTYIKLKLNHTKNKWIEYIEVIQFNGWTSGESLPQSIKDYIFFWEESCAFSNRSTPILLTCYDGVTSCGLYAATSFLLEKIKLEHVCDVCQAVRTIRQNRTQFVSNVRQFTFLYQVVLQYIINFEPYANFN